MVVAFLISFLAGIIYYWNGRSQAERDFVEIYVTDLPANFTRVDVVVEGVYIGAGNYSLPVERPAFDLLALQGPGDGLRIAAGYVPKGNHSEIRIAFASARALLNGAYIDLDMPDGLLTVGHAFGLGRNAGSAILFDINLEQSIVVTSEGLSFRPQVDAVFVHHYGAPGELPQGSSGPDFFRRDPHQFTTEEPEEPQKQRLDPGPAPPSNPFTNRSGPTTTSKFVWSHSPTTPSTTTHAPTSDSGLLPTTTTPYLLPDPGQGNSVPEAPGQIGGWFVRFHANRTGVSAMAQVVDAVGAQLLLTYGAEPAAYIFATPEQAEALSEQSDVIYVEADRLITLNLASSLPAIRMPDVRNPLTGLKDAAGRPVDGRGVGVAIIDIGIDGTHPDLLHHTLSPDPALLANYKVESLFTVDVATTDQTSGHGTHVAGILAGRGIADPAQVGVAPGAKLYAFGIGEGSTTLWPTIALDWLVQNHDRVNPPIRVVSNSWGSGSTYDPNSLVTQLVERLVDEGVVVVFAAGNAGGDGSIAATTAQCQIPKEGVVCVAAQDDQGTGSRDGRVAGYSSRGKLNAPSTWPDLSAPGTQVRSARPLAGYVTGVGSEVGGPYVTLSGTSMAAPHVSGVIAEMLQARPGLSPAQVESILESTAYSFADGGSYVGSADVRYNGSHFAKGHGLLDAYEAIRRAQTS